VKVRVSVRLKPAILDPQGKTIQQALAQLGFSDVHSVRVGKLIEMEVEGEDIASVRARVDEFSRKLLANMMMETYEIELVGANDGKA
jgi:phosphoribosylformylglycinamidine synthase PurS subunit